MESEEFLDDKTKSVLVMIAGTEVSHYQIITALGAGGMGEVYLARDTILGRNVALKFMPDSLSSDSDYRTRFLREAQASARLSHPNIIIVHEVGEFKGRPFIAMEHIEGATLKEHIAKKGFSVEQSVEIVAQIAGALQCAHNHGVIHRDVKPSNILIDPYGRPRLLDFGLAMVHDADQITKTGSTMGTFDYMSPEQVMGKELDHRTDIFSLGVVFFELITGMNPFKRDSRPATLHAIAYDEPPEIDKIRPGIPRGLAEVITGILEKNRDRRYQKAGDIKQDLLKVQAQGNAGGIVSKPPSIAVLPFANLSTDSEQEYFCDGIAEDIISDLSRVSGLKVVARTSAFAFKGKNEDVREIGRKLNVAYVLEGSVRKGGDRLRITAQLIEVAEGYHVWAEKYDRKIEDIFAIQDEISQNIVEKLKGHLGPGDRDSVPDVTVEAYQLYSQGRHFINKRNSENLFKALDYFRKCAAIAPDYALVHAGLADAYFLLFAYDLLSPRDAVAKARVEANRAIELKPRLADAHATLGGILTYHDWAWKDAEKAFLQTLELSPGHATAHQWYGELLSYLKRDEEAEKHLKIALEYDPLSAIALIMTAWHYMRSGQYETSLEFISRIEKLGGMNDFAHVIAAADYMYLEDRENTYRHLNLSRKVSGDTTLSIAISGHFGFLLGDKEAAREAKERLHRKEGYLPEAYLAALHHDLGEEEEAVGHLHDALRRRDAELIFMASMPYYASIRKDPKMMNLLSILGLPSDENH